MPPIRTNPQSAELDFLDSSWKRSQRGHPSLPVLALDREGTIQVLSRAARQALEYRSNDRIDDCFFSHVHKQNLQRVMHDLADMVCRGKRRVQWLLRLQTGNGRWRWYRALVQNHLRTSDERVFVHIRPL